MKKLIKYGVILAIIASFAATAGAVPRLQTYIIGADYYHIYQQDFATWISHSPNFDLKVVGYWHPEGGFDTDALSLRGELFPPDYMDTWLMISTPSDQAGRVYINGYEVMSYDLYGTAVPAGIEANPSLPNHTPAGGARYGFFYVGQLDNNQVGALNYCHGMIGTPGWGSEIDVKVDVSGYSWVHFDAVGIDSYGETWVNPYSRDASYFSAVPEPGTLSLLGLGLLGIVPILRKRR